MNDDDFSGIVRSGSQHSVSVSEVTGNAKKPKNTVVSHEEETEARKRAFEEKALAALNAEKALATALAEHTEHVASDEGMADANIQKVAASKEAANRQGIAGEHASLANVQNVATDTFQANNQKVGADKIQDNIQTVANDKGPTANVQNVSSEALAANLQSVSSGNIASNKQNVAGEKTMEANRQGIPTDVIAPNQQNIAGEMAIDANRQGIPTDGMTSNVQKVPVGNIADNVQDIGSKSLAANNQAIEQGAMGLNRQGIANDAAAAANLQTLAKNNEVANRQSLGLDGNGKNQQGIATDAMETRQQKLANLDGQNNHQPIKSDGVTSNLQAIPQSPGIAPNNQPIGTDAAALNRQGVDNGKIDSHFERLPSGDGERQKVDFPTESHSGSTASQPASSASSNASKPSAPAASRAPLTTAEQQRQAKLKREQMNDAFHGRLAGIKHNVDVLNDRLTDFEEKVHKEDGKLDKGNPDDFDIKLD
jgi:hypothetical protein